MATVTTSSDAVAGLQILSELQNRILGQRVTPLTPVEVNKLFQAPITVEFNLILLRGLQRKIQDSTTGSTDTTTDVIDANLALVQAIAKATTEEYLIPIALCLRYGANSNMYIKVDKVGTMHIIGYVYFTLGRDGFAGSVNNISEPADEIVINTIIAMLIAKGSKATMPMFQQLDPANSKIISSQTLTVKDWLTQEGYTHILNELNVPNYSMLAPIIGVQSTVNLSIVLDLPQLKGREYNAADMTRAISSHSLITFKLIPIPTVRKMMDNRALVESVDYLNADAFERINMEGYTPSYILINHILTSMVYYRAKGDTIAVLELERMLKLCINTGSQLDQDQYNIVATLGLDLVSVVNASYDVPFWRKLCSNKSTELSPALRKLAINLNVDNTLNKAGICNRLADMAKSDKEVLKQAAAHRQQERLNSQLGNVNEYIGDKTANLTCSNKSSLANDPMSYNDADIAYYRDDAGTVWCFTSDQFQALKERRANVYTSVKLPDSFISQIDAKIALMKVLSDENTALTRVPRTFDQAIDTLANKDSISNVVSAAVLEQFYEVGARYSVSKSTINSLSKESMLAALNTVGYKLNFSLLTTGHALITTAHVVTQLEAVDQATFFTSVAGYNYQHMRQTVQGQ